MGHLKHVEYRLRFIKLILEDSSLRLSLPQMGTLWALLYEQALTTEERALALAFFKQGCAHDARLFRAADKPRFFVETLLRDTTLPVTVTAAAAAVAATSAAATAPIIFLPSARLEAPSVCRLSPLVRPHGVLTVQEPGIFCL